MKKAFTGSILFWCLFCISFPIQASVIPNDDTWFADISNSGVSFVLWGEYTSHGSAVTNAFGLYQDTGSGHPLTLEIFAGSDSPWARQDFNWGDLLASGFSLDREFGFYLDADSGLYLSDPDAGHDNDGNDYMSTWAVGNWYALGWEDRELATGSRCGGCCGNAGDFDDMIVKVSGMSPTPIPGAMFLLLAGLPVAMLRKKL